MVSAVPFLMLNIVLHAQDSYSHVVVQMLCGERTCASFQSCGIAWQRCCGCLRTTRVVLPCQSCCDQVCHEVIMVPLV